MRRIGHMTFPDKLKILTDPRRFPNQKALAEAIGISKSTLGRWLSGEAWPDIKEAKVLADLFEVSVDYLADDSLDEPSADSELTDDERWVLRIYRKSELTAEEASERLLIKHLGIR